MCFFAFLVASHSLFCPQAGTLLSEDGEEDKDDSDCKSDVGNVSYVFEFIPSQTSKLLAHSFDRQLQIGEVAITAGELATSHSDEETGDLLHDSDAMCSIEGLDDPQERAKKNMLKDEESDQDDSVGNSDDYEAPPTEPALNVEEELRLSDARVKNRYGNCMPEQGDGEQDMNTRELPEKRKQDEAHTKTEKQANLSSIDSDSGRPESSEEEKQGTRTASERDSGLGEYSPRPWENHYTDIFNEKERGIMSELSADSGPMDEHIIV